MAWCQWFIYLPSTVIKARANAIGPKVWLAIDPSYLS